MNIATTAEKKGTARESICICYVFFFCNYTGTIFIPHEVIKKAFYCSYLYLLELIYVIYISKIHKIIFIIDQCVAPSRRAT